MDWFKGKPRGNQVFYHFLSPPKDKNKTDVLMRQLRFMDWMVDGVKTRPHSGW